MKRQIRFSKKAPKASGQASVKGLRQTLAQWERKRKLWKFYFYSFVVLPVFMIMLAVKVLRTYVRIKLQEIAITAEIER